MLCTPSYLQVWSYSAPGGAALIRMACEISDTNGGYTEKLVSARFFVTLQVTNTYQSSTLFIDD